MAGFGRWAAFPVQRLVHSLTVDRATHRLYAPEHVASVVRFLKSLENRIQAAAKQRVTAAAANDPFRNAIDYPKSRDAHNARHDRYQMRSNAFLYSAKQTTKSWRRGLECRLFRAGCRAAL